MFCHCLSLPPLWHVIFLLMNNHSLLTFPCHETLMPECEQKMKGPVLPEDRWTLIIKLPRASNCSWQPSNWRKNLWRLIKTCQDSCCDNEERWWWSVDIITASNIMLLTLPSLPFNPLLWGIILISLSLSRSFNFELQHTAVRNENKNQFYLIPIIIYLEQEWRE